MATPMQVPAGGARDSGPPGYPELPPGGPVELPSRGSTFVRQGAGPVPDAPTLVLLHGLTATADLNWFAAFEPLAAHGRVVAPDLRGHGGGPIAHPFRLVDAADDVAALISELGVGPAVVVGYSMGGAVAQLVWARRPDLVAGLVLCATAADYRETTWRGRLVDQPRRMLVAASGRVLPEPVRAKVRDRIGAASVASLQSGTDASTPLQRWAASQLARNDPFQIASAGAALRRFHIEPGAGIESSGRVPVALVVTGQDTVVPTADQLALAERLPPGTTVHRIDAGHGCFVEDPDRFVPALVDACASVVQRRTV